MEYGLSNQDYIPSFNYYEDEEDEDKSFGQEYEGGVIIWR
jgi:hypothetical protein